MVRVKPETRDGSEPGPGHAWQKGRLMPCSRRTMRTVDCLKIKGRPTGTPFCIVAAFPRIQREQARFSSALGSLLNHRLLIKFAAVPNMTSCLHSILHHDRIPG